MQTQWGLEEHERKRRRREGKRKKKERRKKGRRKRTWRRKDQNKTRTVMILPGFIGRFRGNTQTHAICYLWAGIASAPQVGGNWVVFYLPLLQWIMWAYGDIQL